MLVYHRLIFRTHIYAGPYAVLKMMWLHTNASNSLTKICISHKRHELHQTVWYTLVNLHNYRKSPFFMLVGGFNPSEKYEHQLGWLFPIYGKIKNVRNHRFDLIHNLKPEATRGLHGAHDTLLLGFLLTCFMDVLMKFVNETSWHELQLIAWLDVYNESVCDLVGS